MPISTTVKEKPKVHQQDQFKDMQLDDIISFIEKGGKAPIQKKPSPKPPSPTDPTPAEETSNSSKKKKKNKKKKKPGLAEE